MDVDFDAPTKDWARDRNQPTIDIYLYDIRQDVAAASTSGENVRDDDGLIVRAPAAAEVLPPRLPRDGLDAAAEDEHRLLSALLVLLPPPRDGAGRAARRARSTGSASAADGGRPAAAPGPRPRRRVVGAGRRAQAVARRHRHRPAATRPDPEVGPPVLVEPVLSVVRPSPSGRAEAPRRAGDARRAAAAARDTGLEPGAPRRAASRPGAAAACADPGAGARPWTRRGRDDGRHASARDPAGPAPRARPTSTCPRACESRSVLPWRGGARSTRRRTTRSAACTSATSRSTSCCARPDWVERRGPGTARRGRLADAATARRRRGGRRCERCRAPARLRRSFGLDALDVDMLLVGAGARTSTTGSSATTATSTTT